MPTFTYRRVGATGAIATLDAPDRASAIRELLRRGETPVSLEQSASGEAGSANPAAGPTLRAIMSKAEMASFIRELATALHAGLPLVQALRTIAKQGRSPKQKLMMLSLIENVEAGKSLAEAAQAWGRPFDDLLVNLLHAGEASGKLAEVMTQSADLLDKSVKLRRSILAATLYPMILLTLIVVAIVVIVTFIVPNVLKNIGGNVATLPWPTRVVQGLADLFSGYWFVILPALALGVFALARLYAQPAARLWIDDRLLSFPVLGRLLRDVAVARFTRTLSTLSGAGLPILTSLKITKGTLGNRAMERVVDEVCEQVTAGKTIADPMERSGYFPPMLVQIVNLGERSGRLDELLGQAAGAFEEKTEQSVKLFTTALPPILVVFAALCVGFIVLSIMLPMLSVQDAVVK